MNAERYPAPIATVPKLLSREQPVVGFDLAASMIRKKLLSEIERKKSLFSMKLEELEELRKMAMIAESRADLASEEMRFYEEEVELATQSLVTLERFICELIRKEEEE